MTTMQDTAICPECGKEMDHTAYTLACDQCLAKKEEE